MEFSDEELYRHSSSVSWVFAPVPARDSEHFVTPILSHLFSVTSSHGVSPDLDTR